MTVKQLVVTAASYAGLNKSELARRLGWTPQLLEKRLTTGKLTLEEYDRIGKEIGADFKIYYEFPDGKQI
ncbi:MAG: XRE family transcriptional regulator [Spirochaetia bacterium]|nr:XRE family transcriptional regulator [Spirochaetia bacterium]